MELRFEQQVSVNRPAYATECRPFTRALAVSPGTDGSIEISEEQAKETIAVAEHYKMTSWKKLYAIREAELPSVLPGKKRFRSRRSGR